MCIARLFLGILLLASTDCYAGILQSQVVVDGRSNIFSAGLATPSGAGPGVLPVEILLPSGSASIEFTAVTGVVTFDAWLPGTRPYYGPDGGSFAPGGALGITDIQSLNGISGLQFNRNTFLAGVFLSEARKNTAPARLNLHDGNFLSLAPELQQSFFIGDGLNDIGARQQFKIPTGATRLFLGLVDGFDPVTLTISGTPRFYDDNGGNYIVNYATSIVPEPSSLACFVAIAACGIPIRHRRNFRSKKLE